MSRWFQINKTLKCFSRVVQIAETESLQRIWLRSQKICVGIVAKLWRLSMFSILTPDKLSQGADVLPLHWLWKEVSKVDFCPQVSFFPHSCIFACLYQWFIWSKTEFLRWWWTQCKGWLLWFNRTQRWCDLQCSVQRHSKNGDDYHVVFAKIFEQLWVLWSIHCHCDR